MNSIIRLWNQNRRQIIIIGLVVVFFFIIIQILNQMAKEENRNTNIENTNIELKEELPTESIISGTTVSEKTTKENTQIVSEFIENCNTGKVQDAYALLTDKCKEALFPTEEIFKTNYYDIIFTEKRIYNIKNWISNSGSNTYLIEYFNDVMATGKVEEEIAFQDYITVNNKEDGKININSFISYKEINKTAEIDNIKITIIGKQIHKQFEKYEIQVDNKTDKTILLDLNNELQTVYLQDSNDVKYSAVLSELSKSDLIIEEDASDVYNIKFNKIYNPSKNLKSMSFTNIIKDYESYMQDIQNYNERTQITIEM